MSEQPTKALTLRQNRFVEAMADPSTRSQTEAGRIAGYKHPTPRASENVRKSEVATEIEKRRAELSDKARGVLPVARRLLREDMDAE